MTAGPVQAWTAINAHAELLSDAAQALERHARHHAITHRGPIGDRKEVEPVDSAPWVTQLRVGIKDANATLQEFEVDGRLAVPRFRRAPSVDELVERFKDAARELTRLRDGIEVAEAIAA